MRSGSSARTVPAPTRIASCSSRSRSASRRAVSPEIHCDSPGPGRRLPVEGRRPLQVHVRPSLARRREERLVHALGLRGVGPDEDLDAPLAQSPDAAARDPRVGILERADDAGDPGRENRLRAGRRPAEVRARLEVHEQRRAARALPRGRQRRRLGVGPARPLVPSLADDHPVGVHDDAADPRVRRHGEPPPRRELEDAAPEEVERGRRGRRRVSHRRVPTRTRRDRNRGGRRPSRRRRRISPEGRARGRSRG